MSESSNRLPQTKAIVGLPELKKAAPVRHNRGVAGGRTGIDSSGLRLACDGQLRLCLQLDSGLFVTELRRALQASSCGETSGDQIVQAAWYPRGFIRV